MIENERGQWLAEIQKRDAEIASLRQQLAVAREGLGEIIATPTDTDWWLGIACDTLAKLGQMEKP